MAIIERTQCKSNAVRPLCLSAEDAAEFLGLSRKHARRIKYLGRTGRLRRIGVGRTFVFPVDALEEYVRGDTIASE